MTATPTLTDLQNFKRDIDDAAEIVASIENTDVQTRLGKVHKSLTGRMEELQTKLDTKDAEGQAALATAKDKLTRYAAINYTGDFVASTSYEANDVWKNTADGSLWIVPADYTSGATAQADIDAKTVRPHQDRDRVESVDTIADLRLVGNRYAGKKVSVGGHTVVGVGGGEYAWKVGDFTAEILSDDDGVIIAAEDDATGTQGAWFLKLNGYVTPETFGGGELGFKAALSSGYNVKDGESEYTITSLATLPNDKVVALVAVTGANAENVRYAPDGSDTTLIAVDIDCTSGIALHQNQPNSMDQITALSKIKSAGYAFLSNDNSDGSDGYIFALNYAFSENADAVEINHPDENSSHFSTIGNILDAGLSGSSTSSGFGVGVAGTQGHITALNHVRSSRREAYHVEDGQRRGVVIGNTGLTNLHGVLVLPPKVSDGEAHGPVVVGNHLEEATGTKTGKYGLYSVNNAAGSIEWPVYAANHLDGFEYGAWAGAGYSIVNDNVFKDVDYPVSVAKDGHAIGINGVRGQCLSLARMHNRCSVGKLVSETQPTNSIIEFTGSATEAGSIMSGFNIIATGEHTGSGSIETVATTTVELNSNILMSGKISIIPTNSNYSVLICDVVWDGSTLTTSNVVRKGRGSASSTAVIESGGVMCVEMFAGVAVPNLKLNIDFNGFYYKES
jgi:hypothetical protein